MNGLPAFLLALYGAGLSTYLGYLALRRDRHRVGITFRLEALDGPPVLAVCVVNRGQRPVTIRAGHFMFRGETGGWVPPLQHEPKLPLKLQDGDELFFRFAIGDVPTEVDGFVVWDTHRRTEHRQYFSEEFVRQISLFRTMTDPVV